MESLLLRGNRQLLVDTNAFIYFLTGMEPYVSVLVPLFRRVQTGDVSLIVSAVTEAELLVRPERNNDREAIERIGDLLSEDGINVVGVDRKMARRAGALRARHPFGLTDAIIVATAIETGCDAIVGNNKVWLKQSDIPFAYLEDLVRNGQIAGKGT